MVAVVEKEVEVEEDGKSTCSTVSVPIEQTEERNKERNKQGIDTPPSENVAKDETGKHLSSITGVLPPAEYIDGMWAQSVQFPPSHDKIDNGTHTDEKILPVVAVIASIPSPPPPAAPTNVHHQQLINDFGLDELE